MIAETAPGHIHELDLQTIPAGTLSENWLHVINNGIGEPIRIPILVAKGRQEGPVLGLTAAIHGNELNGIPVIQRLFSQLNLEELSGTVVGVLAANVPALLLEQRKFNDGVDLNRIAPGKPNGDVSQIYINRLVHRILKPFQYLIDLHTASFGRINSWYIRADMQCEQTSRLARLQNPDIILHNPPNDNTFRGAAAHNGIYAITLELKDPHVFQFDVIEEALTGLYNVLYDLKMLDGHIVCPVENTILCDSSYWMYTDEGGILEVYPRVGQLVQPGEIVAEVKTIFGKITKTYRASDAGIVIGKSVNPVNQTGSRILHLGLNPREIPCLVGVKN